MNRIEDLKKQIQKAREKVIEEHIKFERLHTLKNQLLTLFRKFRNISGFNTTNRIANDYLDNQTQEYKKSLENMIELEDEYKKITDFK